MMTVTSSMRHGQRYGVRFPFSCKPSLNVHLEDPNNLLDYSELLITPGLAELISKETKRYAQQFLENTLNLKIRLRVHQWNNTNR
jgi:hypothetical protein